MCFCVEARHTGSPKRRSSTQVDLATRASLTLDTASVCLSVRSMFLHLQAGTRQGAVCERNHSENLLLGQVACQLLMVETILPVMTCSVGPSQLQQSQDRFAYTFGRTHWRISSPRFADTRSDAIFVARAQQAVDATPSLCRQGRRPDHEGASRPPLRPGGRHQVPPGRDCAAAFLQKFPASSTR